MENYLKLRDGIELFYRKDIVESPKAIVLINHGFAEHLVRYDYITQSLNYGGYSVYRYDLRGHGRTKSILGHVNSYEDFILDCDEMVELIKRENNDLSIFMLGHSMGGFITCLYGLNYPNKLKGQIFSGAAVNTLPKAQGYRSYLYEFLNLFAKKMRIKNPITKDICRDENVVTDYTKDPLILKDATLNFYVQFLVKGRKYINKNIQRYSYPCLILHGGADKIVPKEVAVYLYNSISSKDKEIKIYDDLYHEILNEKEKSQVMDNIISWLNHRG
ncbi:lysophospholipase [Tissierella carlieri]|jgi:acylglycerol lipase|uniref:alpha/beta hydrolase n=1 Tax=Tissierella carlieri TaxID=689904 RepID=UPI002805221B|nr:alpha/beta hydrolase [uncultured Tissierella sp.]MDU5080880.1 lysophospholipase [Bacillota bacterium]